MTRSDEKFVRIIGAKRLAFQVETLQIEFSIHETSHHVIRL